MGTSASTNQQSASSVRAQPEKDVKQPVAVSHSEVINTPAGLAKSFVTNKVARVVITHNLKEEFQVHDNFLKAHYVIGSMNDSLPEHYLVQGKYFMINDLSDKVDNLLTVNNYGAPNFRQIQLGYPVYGMGQATMNGFHMVLQKLKEEGNQEIIYFNVREEPVIFLHQDDDFIPYTPRDRNDLQENLYNLTSRDQVENLELIIKNELLDFAVLSNQTYFVYHGTEQFVTEPLPKTIENVEDVRISEEVYRGHVFTMPYFRYKRLPLPVAATLEEADFDSFISTVRFTLCLIEEVSVPGAQNNEGALNIYLNEYVASGGLTLVLNNARSTHVTYTSGKFITCKLWHCSNLSPVMIFQDCPNMIFRAGPKPPPALLFSCQTGVGRSNLGMIVGALIIAHRTQFPQMERSVEENISSPERQFQLVEKYMTLFPNGQRIVEEVDSIVNICSEMLNLKESIFLYKDEVLKPDVGYQKPHKDSREASISKTFQSLQRYFYLIAFNSYLHEQYPLAFSVMFSTWIRRKPFFYRLLSAMFRYEMKTPDKLLTQRLCVLLADEYLDLDEMSSRRQMKVANYRKVSKMPVCGIAQPNPEGLLRILSHLTDDTRKFTRVLCLNLRGEAVLEADGQMYSLREVNNLQQEVIIPATTVEQLEEIEAASKMDLLSSKTPIETWKEETKEMKQFNSCMTLKEVYSQAAIQYPQLQNHRIPIPDCAAPTEEEFDVFLNVVRSHLITDQNTVIVLNCHDGKGRTTAGMAISLLLVWHIKGFPEFIVEDMVSIPDAKYTKGEFEAVLSLVRILPNGNEMKQEVDRALDQVSDSMTPMMHHLRELILNTYKKSKGAKDKDTAESLHLCSLQYLERYLYLILFDTYLHLEKPGKWERTFKDWMTEVAAPAGVFEILDNLGFSEFEDPGCTPMCRMRNRWQQQRGYKVPTFGDMI
ncbi:paladin-like [Leucoraja erinacea]|uniref:paladin-like n=1 Tax=Leucoraja erinaceus TaxID=7782 RepID=UPI002456A9B5|nr:paladin-like [Leucoraja erinacea]